MPLIVTHLAFALLSTPQNLFLGEVPMAVSNGEQPKGLKGKWWYRLLRVILLALYGLTLLAAFGLIYSDNNPRKFVDPLSSLIVCDDGKTYLFADIDPLPSSWVWSLELETGKRLYEAHANEARNLCSYGQALIPSEGLVTVQISDGPQITGVPIASTKGPGGRLDPGLLTRYQRWRSSPETERDFDLSKVVAVEFHDLHNYTVKVQFNAKGSWAKVVSYAAIGWLVIHLVLVAIRGAVLYVAVGRFLPVSGLRGWLVL